MYRHSRSTTRCSSHGSGVGTPRSELGNARSVQHMLCSERKQHPIPLPKVFPSLSPNSTSNQGMHFPLWCNEANWFSKLYMRFEFIISLMNILKLRELIKIKQLWLITNYILFWIKDHWKQRDGVRSAIPVWKGWNPIWKKLLKAAVWWAKECAPTETTSPNPSHHHCWHHHSTSVPLLKSPAFMYSFKSKKLKHSSQKTSVQLLGRNQYPPCNEGCIPLLLSAGACWAQSTLLYPTPRHPSVLWEPSAPPYLSLKAHTRHLWPELQSSADKSSQHFCRIREHGLLKCLAAVKRRKLLEERKNMEFMVQNRVLAVLCTLIAFP